MKAPAYGIRYVENTIPDRLQAGVTYGVRVTVENTGRLTWRSNPPDGKPVDLFVFIDNVVFSLRKLPRDEIRPGEQVTIHFALRGPLEEGVHYLKVDAVHQHVTWFSDQGIKPLVIRIQVEKGSVSRSARFYELALKHNLWHYLPTQGIEESRDGRGFPLFVSQARGCRIWDLEGREYIDYTMGWGSTILGYADARVQNAIREMLETAPLGPFPYPVEMDVSRLLVEDFPCAEMVVFGKNGSDVCTVAARLARLSTKKRTILSCGFHGWQDFGLEYISFADSGIPDRPERFLYKFKFNDKDDFFRLYDRCRCDLAAVMIEPSGPWGGDETGPESDADPAFLQEIAAAVRRVGALLIFDEIITGYRYPQKSVQKATGVIPDLTCLGKAIASGMPLSALLGPSRLFFGEFLKTHYCPTFKGEIYSLAAAKAAIEIYRKEPVIEHIWEYGEKLRKGIHSICHEIGIAAECKGPPFRMALMFKEKNPEVFRLKKTLYIQELLKEGVITATSVMLPSYAHDRNVLEKTLSAIGHALEVVAEAERTDAFHRFLEIPLL